MIWFSIVAIYIGCMFFIHAGAARYKRFSLWHFILFLLCGWFLVPIMCLMMFGYNITEWANAD